MQGVDKNVLDKNGNPRVFFRGMDNAPDDGNFNDDSSFTPDHEYASMFMWEDDENGTVTPVFLGAKNLLDARNSDHRKKFAEIYGKPMSDGHLDKMLPQFDLEEQGIAPLVAAGFDGVIMADFAPSSDTDANVAWEFRIFDSSAIINAEGGETMSATPKFAAPPPAVALDEDGKYNPKKDPRLQNAAPVFKSVREFLKMAGLTPDNPERDKEIIDSPVVFNHQTGHRFDNFRPGEGWFSPEFFGQIDWMGPKAAHMVGDGDWRTIRAYFATDRVLNLVPFRGNGKEIAAFFRKNFRRNESLMEEVEGNVNEDNEKFQESMNDLVYTLAEFHRPALRRKGFDVILFDDDYGAYSAVPVNPGIIINADTGYAMASDKYVKFAAPRRGSDSGVWEGMGRPPTDFTARTDFAADFKVAKKQLTAGREKYFPGLSDEEWTWVQSTLQDYPAALISPAAVVAHARAMARPRALINNQSELWTGGFQDETAPKFAARNVPYGDQSSIRIVEAAVAKAERDFRDGKRKDNMVNVNSVLKAIEDTQLTVNRVKAGIDDEKNLSKDLALMYIEYEIGNWRRETGQEWISPQKLRDIVGEMVYFYSRIATKDDVDHYFHESIKGKKYYLNFKIGGGDGMTRREEFYESGFYNTDYPHSHGKNAYVIVEEHGKNAVVSSNIQSGVAQSASAADLRPDPESEEPAPMAEANIDLAHKNGFVNLISAWMREAKREGKEWIGIADVETMAHVQWGGLVPDGDMTYNPDVAEQRWSAIADIKKNFPLAHKMLFDHPLKSPLIHKNSFMMGRML